MSAITSDGSDIIKKSNNIKCKRNDMKNINNFEINEICEWITINKFERVGLQFPIELFKIGARITKRLNTMVKCSLALMDDEILSSCCVAIKSGEIFSVDAIVHFGHACLTPTNSKLPVKYAFGNDTFDDDTIDNHVELIQSHIQTQYENGKSKCITILYDFKYKYHSEQISKKLLKLNFNIHHSYPNLVEFNDKCNIQSFGSRLIESHNNCSNENIILFIVDYYDHSVKTTLASIFYLHKNLSILNPIKNEILNVSSEINSFLNGRYCYYELAKSSKRVVIIIGTVNNEKIEEASKYLFKTMKQAGKKVNLIQIWKINEAKVTNFSNCDVMVLINCPESCLEFSSREDRWYVPIVTPYEMILACDPTKEFNPYCNEYLTDFRDLLKEENRVKTIERDNNLLTNNDDECSALVSRLDSDWSISAIDRSTCWYGLDPMLGQTEVAKIKEGRSGIASGYLNEPK